MLTAWSGERYYLLEDPAPKLRSTPPTGTFGFQHVSGFDLAKKTKSLRVSDIANAGETVAPQRETARALLAVAEEDDRRDMGAEFLPHYQDRSGRQRDRCVIEALPPAQDPWP